MLAISPVRNPKNEMEAGFSIHDDVTDFPDFATGNLLDSIDFNDIFVGISDGDVLPDLEMDPEILVDFSVGEDSDSKISSSVKTEDDSSSSVKHEDSAAAASDLVTDPEPAPVNHPSPTSNKSDKGRKSSTVNGKNPPGKRKVKVDWTPELHRRFVQAVEQLGVEKAVPSRILELMGIDCLTRHNIASHLQKYRSHRKHLLAREAEAASWGQRRPAYGSSSTSTSCGKRYVNPWIAPTMGFPPVTPMPHLRPLHVWGHPSVDQPPMHIWPKHQILPPQVWPPAQPPLPPTSADPSFWISPHQHVPTPGTPCFPPHLAPTRYQTALVPGIPPPAMIKVELPGIGYPTMAPGQALTRPPSEVHPSKETVDAVIGDVLKNPWLPLPLGLKPPSVDSVMVELQCQGISKVPPTCG